METRLQSQKATKTFMSKTSDDTPTMTNTQSATDVQQPGVTAPIMRNTTDHDDETTFSDTSNSTQNLKSTSRPKPPPNLQTPPAGAKTIQEHFADNRRLLCTLVEDMLEMKDKVSQLKH